MSQFYEAQIVHFDRKRVANSGIELKMRVNVEGYENVHFWSPVVYPNQENPWIDWEWEAMNSHGQPKIKKKAGEILKIQGEMMDFSDVVGTSWVLVGEVL